MNAFFITPAFGGRQSMASLFSTHPPLEQRLEQLARISAQLGQ
jgi:heat shock protein HtpX